MNPERRCVAGAAQLHEPRSVRLDARGCLEAFCNHSPLVECEPGCPCPLKSCAPNTANSQQIALKPVPNSISAGLLPDVGASALPRACLVRRATHVLSSSPRPGHSPAGPTPARPGLRLCRTRASNSGPSTCRSLQLLGVRGWSMAQPGRLQCPPLSLVTHAFPGLARAQPSHWRRVVFFSCYVQYHVTVSMRTV